MFRSSRRLGAHGQDGRLPLRLPLRRLLFLREHQLRLDLDDPLLAEEARVDDPECLPEQSLDILSHHQHPLLHLLQLVQLLLSLRLHLLLHLLRSSLLVLVLLSFRLHLLLHPLLSDPLLHLFLSGRLHGMWWGLWVPGRGRNNHKIRKAERGLPVL